MTDVRSSPPQTSLPAFERFFREQYPVVVRIAFGVVGDAQAAQDVAQDVFIAALRRFPDPGDPGQAGAWVRAAAAHTALNAIRGERRRDRRQQLAGIEVAPPGPRRPCWTGSRGSRSGGRWPACPGGPRPCSCSGTTA
jgi:DNA-directed RNA polymerase specialized sigma24 family protein